MSRPAAAPVSLTALAFAKEMGVSVNTVQRGLRVAGIKVEPAGRYPLKVLVQAVLPDGKVERARLTRAQADREELEVSKLRGELVEMDEVTAILRRTYQPIRDALVAMPASLAARCNPADPQMASGALMEGRDAILRLLHSDSIPANVDEQAVQSD